IAEPVRLYQVLTDPAAVGKTVSAVPRPRRGWRWPALAVALGLALAAGGVAWVGPWQGAGPPRLGGLPLYNMSADAEQGYFADGITEDLTTDLARIPGLFVISRSAAFRYKGKAVQPAQLATELGVRYLLEGSVQRAGGALRINVQLIDAHSG